MRTWRFIPDVSTKTGRGVAYCLLFLLLAAYGATYPAAAHMRSRYQELVSDTQYDRDGELIRVLPNGKGYYLLPPVETPPAFETMLLRKEDQLFYYHLGFNPLRMLRAVGSIATGKRAGGSSTLTEQVVKNLLGNETERSLGRKVKELIFAVSLELHASKKEILSMYVNTAYFGKKVEGLAAAAQFYFSKEPHELSPEEMAKLIVALGAPSDRYPGSEQNDRLYRLFAGALGVKETPQLSVNASLRDQRSFFEVSELLDDCASCTLTIDRKLTEDVRSILARHLAKPSLESAKDGAVVVLKLPQNEILALIGSPDPNSRIGGRQLNMALEPRPVGSTIKPFIYLLAFEKGARPYSVVRDEEYAYRIGTGFAFYPKNYDGAFRGDVTLRTALANSLNVPAVKVLEFAGTEDFYDLLERRLGFAPYQPLERYELGIALGALEMDLLTLSHLFSIFPNDGELLPLTLDKNRPETTRSPMATVPEERRVADPRLIRLVTSILRDRDSGVDQFGQRSSLHLPSGSYAVKTGTSRDYHDSWTVGFTPDFLVGVWIGNSDNTPMQELSGASGAGAIWHDVMALLLASPYNRQSELSQEGLMEYDIEGTVEYGLPEDDREVARNIMRDARLISNPHDGDAILFEPKARIPFRSRVAAKWYIDGAYLGSGEELLWQPPKPGRYTIEARYSGTSERISIVLESER